LKLLVSLGCCLVLVLAEVALGQSEVKLELERGKPLAASYKVGWKLIDDQPDTDNTFCVATTREKARLELPFTLQQAGVYELGVRLWGGQVLEAVGIDGTWFKVSPPPHEKPGWQLVEAGRIVLGKGKHTLVLQHVADTDTGLKKVPLDVVYVDYVLLKPAQGTKAPLVMGYATSFKAQGTPLKHTHLKPGEVVTFTAEVSNQGSTAAEGYSASLVLGYPGRRFFSLGAPERLPKLAPRASFTLQGQWVAAPGDYSLYLAIYDPEGTLVHSAVQTFNVPTQGRRYLGFVVLLVALATLVAFAGFVFNLRRLHSGRGK